METFSKITNIMKEDLLKEEITKFRNERAQFRPIPEPRRHSLANKSVDNRPKTRRPKGDKENER